MSAKVRLADTLLRSVGGRQVLLRIPAPAVAGDSGEQLGLAQPQFQDSELGPVVFRKVRARLTADALACELLVSASAVGKLLGTTAYSSATLLLCAAAGVLIDGVLYTITGIASSEAFGEVYLYRLALQAPVAGLI